MGLPQITEKPLCNQWLFAGVGPGHNILKDIWIVAAPQRFVKGFDAVGVPNSSVKPERKEQSHVRTHVYVAQEMPCQARGLTRRRCPGNYPIDGLG